MAAHRMTPHNTRDLKLITLSVNNNHHQSHQHEFVVQGTVQSRIVEWNWSVPWPVTGRHGPWHSHDFGPIMS